MIVDQFCLSRQGGYAVTVFFFLTGFVMFLGYGSKVCRDDFKYWVGLELPEDLVHLEISPSL
jgi:hypothetical protein